MITKRRTRIFLAILGSALLCGCELVMLQEKPKDDQKINRLMDAMETNDETRVQRD